MKCHSSKAGPHALMLCWCHKNNLFYMLEALLLQGYIGQFPFTSVINTQKLKLFSRMQPISKCTPDYTPDSTYEMSERKLVFVH